MHIFNSSINQSAIYDNLLRNFSYILNIWVLSLTNNSFKDIFAFYIELRKIWW